MDELVPLPSAVSPEQISDMATDLMECGMSKDFIELIQRGLHSTKLPKGLRSAKAAESFQYAFDIIGGVPRLALWADKNPDKFYPLVARMIPQTVAPVVADMPQKTKEEQNWPVWLTSRRLAYQESQETASDVSIKNLPGTEG